MDRERLELWRSDLVSFFSDVLSHADGRSYGASLDPWQVEDFGALAERPGCNIWWERPRGHSKTMDGAAVAIHHLLIAPGARAYFCASDRDQAALAFDSLRGFVRRSPLLATTFKLGRWEVAAPSTDARLEVLASDAPSSWGLRPSFVVADELQAWRGDSAEEFFHSLYSSLGKVPGARMLVATTAGWDRESLCWRIRELAQADPAWVFSRRGQCASWISTDFLGEQKRLLPENVYRMLHLNEWGEGEGSLLTAEDWEACHDPLPPLQSGDRTPLVLGVDAGVRHDCFACVAVSRNPAAPIDGVAVRMVKVWVPPRGGDIAFTGPGSPDEWIRQVSSNYGVVNVSYDEYQLASLAQGWLRDGIWAEPFPQGQQRLLADSALYNLVKLRRLRHSGEPELRRHVLNAGFRLSGLGEGLRIIKQSPARHVDAAVALSMAASENLRLNL